jgi:hypothetical protein
VVDDVGQWARHDVGGALRTPSLQADVLQRARSSRLCDWEESSQVLHMHGEAGGKEKCGRIQSRSGRLQSSTGGCDYTGAARPGGTK